MAFCADSMTKDENSMWLYAQTQWHLPTFVYCYPKMGNTFWHFLLLPKNEKHIFIITPPYCTPHVFSLYLFLCVSLFLFLCLSVRRIICLICRRVTFLVALKQSQASTSYHRAKFESWSKLLLIQSHSFPVNVVETWATFTYDNMKSCLSYRAIHFQLM